MPWRRAPYPASLSRGGPTGRCRRILKRLLRPQQLQDNREPRVAVCARRYAFVGRVDQGERLRSLVPWDTYTEPEPSTATPAIGSLDGSRQGAVRYPRSV